MIIYVQARVFDNKGNVVGYEVKNGDGQQAYLNKEQLWEYAKQKIVYNVQASGDYNNPILTGINNFKLKELPSKNLNDYNKKKSYKINEVIAFAVRNGYNEDSKVLKQRFENSADINDTNRCLESSSIEVVKIIKDNRIGMNSLIKQGIKIHGVEAVIGYRIKNVSDKTFYIERVLCTGEKDGVVIELKPGCMVNLSRNELALFASKVEFGWVLKNGVIEIKKSKLETVGLKAAYFIFNNSVSVHDTNYRLALTEAESPEIIEKYFVVKKEKKHVQNSVTQNDVLAYLIRTNAFTKDKEELQARSKEVKIKLEESGELNVPEKNSIGRVTEITGSVFYEDKILGYIIKNTGDKEYSIVRIDLNGNKQTVTINPNEELALNFKEFTNLCGTIEVSCSFKNARIQTKLIRVSDDNDFSKAICPVVNGYPYELNKDKDMAKNIKSVVDLETIKKYFVKDIFIPDEKGFKRLVNMFNRG